MNETKDEKKSDTKPVTEPKPEIKEYTRKEILDAQQAVKVNRWCGEHYQTVLDVLERAALATPPEEEAPSPEPQEAKASPDLERESRSPARHQAAGHHRGR